MTAQAAFTLFCLGTVVIGALVVAYERIQRSAIKRAREKDRAAWWLRYCATVGGEEAAKVVIVERERSAAELDALMRRGFEQMARPNYAGKPAKTARVIRFVPRIVSGGREVKFSPEGGEVA